MEIWRTLAHFSGKLYFWRTFWGKLWRSPHFLITTPQFIEFWRTFMILLRSLWQFGALFGYYSAVYWFFARLFIQGQHHQYHYTMTTKVYIP